MGNTPSSEQPRRAHQKLAKPRVGGISTSNTGFMGSSVPFPTISRLPNAHLAGSSPPPVTDPVPPAYSQLNRDSMVVDYVPSPPDSRLDSGILWPSTPRLRSENGSRRARPSLITASSSDGILSPRISEWNGEPSCYNGPISPEVKPEASFPHRNSQRDPHSHVSHPAASTTLSNPHPASPITTARSTFGENGIPSRRSSCQEQPVAATNILRTRSDATLYAPTRRRSVVRTPGVATRSESREPPLPRNVNLRQSFPASPGAVSRHSSMESSATRRHISMPPPARSATEVPERVATPEDTEYRQLGAIKFGSLHITNGSPVLSPESEKDVEAAWNRRIPARGGSSYFVHRPTAEINEIMSVPNHEPSPVSNSVLSVEGSPVMPASSPSTDHYSRFWPLNDDIILGATDATEGRKKTSPQEVNRIPGPYNSTGNPERAYSKRVSEVDRSASGAGSTSSSTGSRDTISKTDSGYASSLSLKSIIGSIRLKRGGSRNTTESVVHERNVSLVRGSSSTSQETSGREVGNNSTSHPTETAGPQIHTSGGEEATNDAGHEGRRRGMLRSKSVFGSFGALKSRGQKPQHSRGSSDPLMTSTRSKPLKPDQSRPMMTGDDNKRSTLQRIMMNSRRQSLPNMRPREEPEGRDMPSMPSDAAAKLKEYSRDFNENPRRSSFHTPDLEQTRKGSQELPNGSSAPSTEKTMGNMPQSTSVLVPKAPTGRRKSILRSPKFLMNKGNSPDDDEDMLADCILDSEHQFASIANIHRSAGNSAFDQALAALAQDTETMEEEAIRLTMVTRRMPPSKEGLGNRVPQPRLRTRSSAPDFLETVSEPADPGSVDCYSQKKPKTPPPVSIRTRGSRTKRRPRLSHGSCATTQTQPTTIFDHYGHISDDYDLPAQDLDTTQSTHESHCMNAIESPQVKSPDEGDMGEQVLYDANPSRSWPLCSPAATEQSEPRWDVTNCYPTDPTYEGMSSPVATIPVSRGVETMDRPYHGALHNSGFSSPFYRGTSVRG